MGRPPVILIDNPDPGSMEEEADFYRKLGHPTEVCAGPQKQGGCPLLEGRSCPLVEDAEGVIFHLDLDLPENRRLLSKYITYFDDLGVPVRVVVTPEQKQRWAKLLSLVEVWTAPVNISKLDGFSSEVEFGWERKPEHNTVTGS